MRKCTLSVIVPIYNVEEYLVKCIKSIVNQTFRVNEIILVDDGSTDNSGKIAEDISEEYKNIIVIHKENGGLSSARNAGLDIASCEYVAFVDSDDYLDPDMYEVIFKEIQNTGADIGIGAVWREQEDGVKDPIYPLGVKKFWTNKEALIELNSYRYFNMSFCDLIIKRSLFEIAGFGEGQLRFPIGKKCEDYYLMHKVLARAEKICYTSKPMYHYVQRQGSISRNKNVNTAGMEASLAQLDFYRKYFPDIVYIAETAAAFSHMGVYSTCLRQGITCPDELLHKIKKVCKVFLPSVLKNKYIPKIKVLQAFAFCYCIPLYRKIIKNSAHR